MYKALWKCFASTLLKEFISQQESSLIQLQEASKNGRFWIKLDATDMKAGVFESVKGEWNGDYDLGNGEVHQLKANYQYRKHEYKMLCSKEDCADSLSSLIDE